MKKFVVLWRTEESYMIFAATCELHTRPELQLVPSCNLWAATCPELQLVSCYSPWAANLWAATCPELQLVSCYLSLAATCELRELLLVLGWVEPGWLSATGERHCCAHCCVHRLHLAAVVPLWKNVILIKKNFQCFSKYKLISDAKFECRNKYGLRKTLQV